jgi:hypothetical protein
MTDLSSDPIIRACERHFVKPGSAAERTVRSNAYPVFGADGSALEERFDTFIGELRQNDFYKESFAVKFGLC